MAGSKDIIVCGICHGVQAHRFKVIFSAKYDAQINGAFDISQ
jgi:hypothetical protein